MALAVVAAVVAGWGAMAVDRARAADADARQGLGLARQAEGDLGGPTVLNQRAVAGLLARSGKLFAAAGADLASWWLAPAGAVPLLDRQLATARDLAAAAGQVVGVAQVAVERLGAAGAGSHLSGAAGIALLRRLATVTGGAAQALGGLDLGDPSLLVGPVARTRGKVAAEIGRMRRRLEETSSLAAASATLLQGPSTVLVLAANNAEMRSGSGAFLEAGTIQLDNGHARFGAMTQTAALLLPGHGVPISGDFAARWGWMEPNVEWRDLGLTPDFPTTAALAARMWQAKTGQRVDAVVSVDVDAIASLLAATGPVRSGGQSVTAANVIPLLLHDQYVGLAPSAAAQASRQDRLGALAAGVLAAATSGRVPAAALASALSRAAAGRHLMVWSDQSAAEGAWAASGAGGAAPGNGIMVSVINRGANKLDPYLPVTCRLAVAPRGGSTEVTIDVTLANRAPSGLPPYITGTEAGLALPPGGYEGILSFNLPGRARQASVTGYRTLVAAGPEGPMSVLAVPVDVAQGSTRHYQAVFDLAGRHGSVTVMPSARIPAESWTYGTHHFLDTDSHSLSW